MDDSSNSRKSLEEEQIQTVPNQGRRAFLKIAGLGVAGVAVVAGATAATSHHDFPKGNSDANETENKDLKSTDSDANNSKTVDSNQNRLRDVKRSTNSD